MVEHVQWFLVAFGVIYSALSCGGGRPLTATCRLLTNTSRTVTPSLCSTHCVPTKVVNPERNEWVRSHTNGKPVLVKQ